MPEPTSSQLDPIALHLLVMRCQAGDERAFAALMGRFGPRTLGYLTGLVGDAAEDIQQEVWLAVYRGIGALVNPGGFRTWLYRTTRHRAIDWLRREKRERELLAGAAAEAVQSAEPVTEEGDPGLDSPEIRAALSHLAPVHREVLLLRYVQDLAYGEIALVVGCSVGTVRSRLHHARQRLRQALEGAQTEDIESTIPQGGES